MARIPEELSPARTGEALPARAPSGLETKTGQAVRSLFPPSELTKSAPLPRASLLTGSEEVSSLLRRHNLGSELAAAYQQYHTDIFMLHDDPLAQFDMRNLAVTSIRQHLSQQETVANALIQALPAIAHHVTIGNSSIYFNETTTRVLGAPQGQAPKALVQQALSKGLVHGPQMQMLQNQLATPGTPAIQAMTLQQSQASQKKAQAAANAFGIQLRMAIIELHLEEPQKVEALEARSEEVMTGDVHHHFGVPARGQEQQVEESQTPEQRLEGSSLHKRTEEEVKQKRKEKAQAAEELVSRTQKQRKKKLKISQKELREGEKQKEQMKQI